MTQKVPDSKVKDLVSNPEYQDIIARIDAEIDYVDIKPYSHNIIGFNLSKAAKRFGNDVANDIIEEFELEKLGWCKLKD